MATFCFYITYADGDILVLPEGVRDDAESLIEGPSLFLKKEDCPYYWPIELVSRSNGTVTMEEGWKDFADDNKIEEGDFLFFMHVECVFTMSAYANGRKKLLPDGAIIQHAANGLPDPEDRARHMVKHCNTVSTFIVMTDFYVATNFLNIPKDFGDAVFGGLRRKPKEPIRARLHVWNRRWTVHMKKYCPANAVQYKTVDGWETFVRDNDIHTGDVLFMRDMEVTPYSINVTVLCNHGANA